MDFGIPRFIRDDPAYGPGGVVQGVYGDYEDEARRVLRAFTKVMMEGDYNGKPFMFPNTVYRIEGKPDSDDLDLVADLSAKFSIPYFTKAVDKEEYHNVMGCRTRLNSNWTGDPNIDCLRTGNLAYISLNLPRYALKGDFWNELDHAMDVAAEVLLIRKEHGLKLLNKKNIMPFLSQTNKEGDQYYGVDNATLSFGIVGLSDALMVLTGAGLDNKSSRKLGHQILQYINDRAKRLTNDTGDRWTILQSPAESTAGRFAMEDRRKYGRRAPVHGSTGGYYYTNSTHLDVDSGLHLIERVQAEQNFHKETSGGHIFHGWLGERWSSDSIKSFTEKLINNSNLGFWTTTSIYSVCQQEHIIIPSAQFECPQCGSPTEVYDRITGYMQRVSGWNKSKQSEFKDRKRYNE
jgi:ribonucleoside-triphosphate reductase